LLRAHVARANPVWRRAGQQVLAVFRGPAGYVPPDQEEKAATGGRVVPTWDYHVVHVHGRLRAVEDPAWLLDFVREQTRHHEADQPHPWSVADAPRAYIDGMLKAIVGIEIAIERIEGKWKGAPPA
jgi:transcriptional regulator